jgi:dihydrolipoamide dehydrogenase
MGTVHIAIIGGGPGGYVAALRARQLGATVTLIEKEKIGGVCLNWGCIPTKTLLRSAEVFETVRTAEKFGVVAGNVELDWPAVLARKAQVTGQLVGGIEVLLRKAGVEVIKGEARFTGPWSLIVRGADGERTLQPDRIIIAAGSSPISLPIPGLDLPQVIGSDGALELAELPPRMLIIGGGAIGVEFASLFHTCGVDVTLVELLPRLIPNADHDIGEGLAWELEEKGVHIHTSSRVRQIVAGANGAVVCHVEGPDGLAEIEVDCVLQAVGRKPSVDNLGLEVAGIRFSPKGIAVNNQMQTSVPGIYAIGDVVGGIMLAHVASKEGVVAAENAAGGDSFIDYKAVPSCIFSLPEAASVGMSEEQAREAGHTVLVGKFAMVNNGKALAVGETGGFVKFVADEQYGEILGLHIVGAHASDLILEGALALTLEATLEEIDATIHAHPTLGESLAEAALAAHGLALHLPARS